MKKKYGKLFLIVLISILSLDVKAQEIKTSPAFLSDITELELPLSLSGLVGPKEGLKFLDKQEREFLQLRALFSKPELLNDRFWIVAKPVISNKYHSLLIAFYKSDNSIERHIVNYDKDWKSISALRLSFFMDSLNFETSLIEKDMLVVKFHKGNRIHFQRFLYPSNGDFMPFIYPSVGSLIKSNKLLGIRAVKARNGLYYRDDNGEVLGKMDLGKPLLIQSYSKDSMEIRLGEKTLKTRKARIVLNFDDFAKHCTLEEMDYPYAYVPEYYLFKNWFDDSKYGEEYYYSHPEEMGKLEYYEHDFCLASDDGYIEADINLLELFDITRIERKDFEEEIILNQKFNFEDSYKKRNNSFEIIFQNGDKRRFKDSIYSNSEYSPESHFERFPCEKVPNSTLIFNSFFEGSWFVLLNMMNGDTLAYFDGYPFYSPNSNWVISFHSPLDYEDQSSLLQLSYTQNRKAKTLARINFLNWNLEDEIEVFWISDNEFFIKVWQEKEKENSSPKNYFYLKFKILIEA